MSIIQGTGHVAVHVDAGLLEGVAHVIEEVRQEDLDRLQLVRKIERLHLSISVPCCLTGPAAPSWPACNRSFEGMREIFSLKTSLSYTLKVILPKESRFADTKTAGHYSIF